MHALRQAQHERGRWSGRAALSATASLALLLAACGRVQQPPPAPPRVRTVQGPSEAATQACYVDLNRLGVRFSPLADRDFGSGCALLGTVQLVDIGVPVTHLGPVRCGEARAFTGWVRNAVVPAAYQMLGSELARVDSLGSYACRNVVGTAHADRRSGHAIANAIDVGGFALKDGRRITIAADWSSPDPKVNGFLRTVRASACRRFGTVLSPDYNAAHHDHLHLEDDGAKFCR